ncbi:MAG: hypothetical protein ACE5KE_02845 [Methanosarcinales archaeon]
MQKMVNRKKIIKLVFSAIDEINQLCPAEERIKLSTDEILYDTKGRLDSLGLINLIVCLEEKIEDEYGVTISLADERIMDEKSNPFRTIESLVDYISSLFKDKIDGQKYL